MNKLYVRVQPRSGAASFFRCGMLFTLAWALVEVDNATAVKLKAEQMLEVTETRPTDLAEGTPSGKTDGDKSGGGQSGGAGGQPVVPDDPDIRFDAIRAAVEQLDKGDAGLWTKGGKPTTEALAAITGWPVTAAERDAAIGGAQ